MTFICTIFLIILIPFLADCPALETQMTETAYRYADRYDALIEYECGLGKQFQTNNDKEQIQCLWNNTWTPFQSQLPECVCK